MTVNEAREALENLAWTATMDEDEYDVLMEAADAYALAVHVDACQWTKLTEHARKDGRCGDGWYCDKAPKGGSA